MRTIGLASAAMILLTPAGAEGAITGYWSGSTDSNWATPSNWVSGVVPGTGDTAEFNNLSNDHTTISLGAGVTIATINFDTDSRYIATGYTIGAGAVGTETLTLNHSGTIRNYAGVTLTIAGNITGGTGGTAGAKTLDILSTGTTFISGAIGGGSGTIAVAKSGAGILNLTGTNTFTGGSRFRYSGVTASSSKEVHRHRNR